MRHVPCNGYFAHFYPLDDVLLVASASALICLDATAQVRWRRGDLGLDGVVVDAVRDGIVTG